MSGLLPTVLQGERYRQGAAQLRLIELLQLVLVEAFEQAAVDAARQGAVAPPHQAPPLEEGTQQQLPDGAADLRVVRHDDVVDRVPLKTVRGALVEDPLYLGDQGGAAQQPLRLGDGLALRAGGVEQHLLALRLRAGVDERHAKIGLVIVIVIDVVVPVRQVEHPGKLPGGDLSGIEDFPLEPGASAKLLEGLREIPAVHQDGVHEQGDTDGDVSVLEVRDEEGDRPLRPRVGVRRQGLETGSHAP